MPDPIEQRRNLVLAELAKPGAREGLGLKVIAERLGHGLQTVRTDLLTLVASGRVRELGGYRFRPGIPGPSPRIYVLVDDQRERNEKSAGPVIRTTQIR